MFQVGKIPAVVVLLLYLDHYFLTRNICSQTKLRLAPKKGMEQV